MDIKHDSEHSNIILEQYKLCVEMADRVSQRRLETNKFYTTLLSLIIALLSLTISLNDSKFSVFTLPISILGIFLSWVWSTNIKSYRHLNKGKFQVILELEKQLPWPCFKNEWDILKKEKYKEITKVELFIPCIFMSIFAILIVLSIVSAIL